MIIVRKSRTKESSIGHTSVNLNQSLFTAYYPFDVHRPNRPEPQWPINCLGLEALAHICCNSTLILRFISYNVFSSLCHSITCAFSCLLQENLSGCFEGDLSYMYAFFVFLRSRLECFYGFAQLSAC